MTMDGANRDDYSEDSPEDMDLGGSEMGGGEIDRFPVAQLTSRYNLVKSAVYTRINELGIKTERVGNRAYIRAEQVNLMDELHAFIQRGGNTAEFLEMRRLRQPDPPAPEPSSGLTYGSREPAEMLTLLTELARRMQPPPPPAHPLEYFEYLERATQGGWLLSTSELANLLKLPASEIQLYGDRFSEAGFVFTRAGYRAGGEVAWRVSKPLK